MRSSHVLLASTALLVGPSVAFQTAAVGRTLVATPARASAIPALPYPSNVSTPASKRALLSRFSQLGIPKLGKCASKRVKEKHAPKSPSNRRLLALVTTCCLALLARPSAARASVAAFLDPATLTYDEVPGLGLLPNGLPTYNLGVVAALRRKPLAFFAKALAAAACLAWMFGGLIFSLSLGQFEPVPYKSANDRRAEEEARHANWNEYAQRLLGASKGVVRKLKGTDDRRAIEDEAAKMEEAGRYYREQQYRLHHHPVRVLPTKTAPSYLDTLAINEASRHDVPGRYLDTLSGAKRRTWNEYVGQVNKVHAKQVENRETDGRFEMVNNMLTWADYQHLAGELQERKNEVNELKQEVEHLRSLLQIEQSIHQAVPSAASAAATTTDPTVDELKEFERIAQEYEETVKKSSTAAEEADATNWRETQNGLGSGIK